MTINPREITAALPDALLVRCGYTVAGRHPLADDVANMPLADVARCFGQIAIDREPRLKGTHDGAVVGLGMASNDFGFAIANGIRQVLTRRYHALSEHLALCHQIPVKNFREVTLPMVDLGTELLPVGEGGEIRQAAPVTANQAGQTAQLTSFARLLYVSREAILNDEWGTIQSVLTGLAAGASRLENRMMFELLESNPVLADGEFVFHQDMQTTVDSALTETSLGTAIGLLRMQKTRSGEPAGYQAKYLAVDPYFELQAKRLAREAGTDLDVISSPYIKPGHFYVLTDPAMAPVIGRLTLDGDRVAAREPFRLEPVRREIKIDASAFKFSSDFGFVIVDRIGIVRGGVSDE